MCKHLFNGYTFLIMAAMIGSLCIHATVNAQETTNDDAAQNALVNKKQSLDEFIGNIYKLFDKEKFEESGRLLDEKMDTFVPLYMGQGVWVVDNGNCTLIVSDKTGKVTGP